MLLVNLIDSPKTLLFSGTQQAFLQLVLGPPGVEQAKNIKSAVCKLLFILGKLNIDVNVNDYQPALASFHCMRLLTRISLPASFFLVLPLIPYTCFQFRLI